MLSLGTRLAADIKSITTEWCYYVAVSLPLEKKEFKALQWLLGETFEPENLSERSFLKGSATILEYGPRPSFETAWSTTAVTICRACGLGVVKRIERSLRIGLDVELNTDQRIALLASLHDRMTEMPYETQPTNFNTGILPASMRVIPLLGNDWRKILGQVSSEMGFGWDDQDIEMIGHFFVVILKRDPTDVELMQLAQANSEHSRHFFFKGRLVIDGASVPETLMDLIKQPWVVNPGNSLIAFGDDSSAIRGGFIAALVADDPCRAGQLAPRLRLYHPTLTAETHNFPSGVAPYPGAATGTGGRIRDNHAVARGGNVVASAAAYCVSNLHIPDYKLPWEQDGWNHPANLASPLEILIRASDGASDYGNCYGEPVITGFTRSCGIQLADGYHGWFKPIMYTAGVGTIDEANLQPNHPKRGMLVLQVGGPAYRIGVGGGSASSMIQGANRAELDFNAVQRGDPQMEQRLNRLIRACAELGPNNPIIKTVDLGAGGSCNAIPELVHPAGARINLRALPSGDPTLSPAELWGNESQERDAFLIKPEDLDLVQQIAARENIACAVVGEITGDGQLVLIDEADGSIPVDLPLELILGKLPPKTFTFNRVTPKLEPLWMAKEQSVQGALEYVLRLPSVGSKRFLTTKVDRSVTGLVAQQQCVGPNQLTLADYAVIAHSHFELSGTAFSLGEQPMKGLLSPSAMARLAVTEMVLNMAGARITQLSDIKCSANWMLAAKLDGEGAWLYDAASALRDICLDLRIAIDGGKDSLSMAARVTGPDGKETIVKAPGELVIAGYAPMPNITRKVTPDIKQRGSSLIFIDLSPGRCRLGGSALAQAFGQIGDECPDLDGENVDLLCNVFSLIQHLLDRDLIRAIHDRSDGGLIVTLLEMAFAGNVGLDVNIASECDTLSTFFNEEPGLVIEPADTNEVAKLLQCRGIPYQLVGHIPELSVGVRICHNGIEVLSGSMTKLRAIWESTSSALDALQANPDCVSEETEANSQLTLPPRWNVSFVPSPTAKNDVFAPADKPRVAILRSEGSNGDREMAAAFWSVGFETWDVTMTDLLANRVSLDSFRGIAFVGGFAFADVLDAGKGWAGIIRFNEGLREQFDQFRDRPDTFSLGVCNGCQLMSLMGWVPGLDIPEDKQPRFIRNRSERFESRFSAVKILSSPAIMLQGMSGSTLGIWVAHGEGRLHVPNLDDLDRILIERLAPIRFVDRGGQKTETYPFNPNGSPQGITALCSPDGRHLAMMPHPERVFLKWQWPWMPADLSNLSASPWLRLFQNAYTWCTVNA
ncbi:phosphoribosylformylglycinamidine synthase [candidate division Kazan bacterium RIFCSPHIGHO2_01_FULL_49_10]|nr:MAG: phosphoribosylformylglycinamidine synthase [candidate division Kazan bacterium RIFCSPHIGHO2_01_FULL_49_10]